MTFINNNKKVFQFYNHGVYDKWLEFCSKVFSELLKVSLSPDNPIYLVKDKIYFFFFFEKNVKTNLVRILEKALRNLNFDIKSNYCFNDHLVSRNIFSKIFRDKRVVSKRYIKNLRYFEGKN